MTHFVYMWFDKSRKMFYVGMHSGDIDDGYISSSSWLSAEVRYRPHDFKRRIIKTHTTKTEAKMHEGKLLSLIKDHEFGSKYYNYKHGKPKGTKPWNAGKTNAYSQSTLEKMSKAKVGKQSPTKGMTMSKSAENGRKSASKLSAKTTGRKRKYLPDGTWTWEYPKADCLVNKEQSANPHSITV